MSLKYGPSSEPHRSLSARAVAARAAEHAPACVHAWAAEAATFADCVPPFVLKIDLTGRSARAPSQHAPPNARPRASARGPRSSLRARWVGCACCAARSRGGGPTPTPWIHTRECWTHAPTPTRVLDTPTCARVGFLRPRVQGGAGASASAVPRAHEVRPPLPSEEGLRTLT